MAELRPYPFGVLLGRMFEELERADSIFHLPRRRFFLGDSGRDLGLRFHGHAVSTPFGPAAGPQSQMAQNLVLSWLGGARILELKTVQIDDELDIPRPCIDMQTIGFNVEWSQELKLEQSLDEYVKGAMLIEILKASGRLPFAPGMGATLYDMSVGYDLAGIRSPRVQAFIDGMLDCRAVVDRFRAQIPDELREFRDLEFPHRLSDTLTLSTFHGCPPNEIESIIDFLLREKGLHCIVKLNPMLLGPARTRELLCEVMGYEELHVPDTAFERDTRWDEMEGFVGRLGATASHLGLGFGVKFTNTLIVRNHRDFFPVAEKEMYVSGPPLHVLAMNLVGRFRERFGDEFPISFSAGVDRKNFPDAVAIGLVPVTVCSDLLKTGGYGRAKGYFDELASRMDALGAHDLDDFTIRAYGLGGDALDRLQLEPDGDLRRACQEALANGASLAPVAGEIYERWVSEARLLNTKAYVDACTRDPRYTKGHNDKPPRKIGSALELFDCITCDKCVPVCPNDANFTFALPREPIPIREARFEGGQWTVHTSGALQIEQKHQIANFADFCNECGNCDVFCPEDGGPYIVKPRFFGSLADWERFETLDGFHCEHTGDGPVIHGRFGGHAVRLTLSAGRRTYAGEGFELTLSSVDPLLIKGTATGPVDLTYYDILLLVYGAVYGPGAATYPGALSGSGNPG